MRHPLDLDVGGLVCDSLQDTTTVLSFSLASRALHTVAVKRLLSMKPITLKDERSVRAFHAFVLADPESRLPFLRALNISITKVKQEARQEVVQCILELLECATHLESLTLPHPERTFKCLEWHSNIPETIIRLSTLRELGLLEECKEMPEIVHSTHSASSLRVLRVSLDTLPTSGGDYGLKMAELDGFLCHLIPTLEVLDIRETTLVLDAKGAEYPALRSLVAAIEEGIIRTDILVSKFPALDGTLGVGSVTGALQDDEPKQRRIRASNQERQKKRCWKHLDCVMGDVLGLTCPVRHLMVDGYCSHKRSQMAEVLRATPPTHLKLSAILYHGDDFFEDLFPSEVVPRLTHFALLLEYSNPPPDDVQSDGDAVITMQWSALLVGSHFFTSPGWDTNRMAYYAKIIDSIRALRLSHFRLFVHYDIDLSSDECRPYSKDFVRSIADVDHVQLAAQLMDAIPSLQSVFVSMGGKFRVKLNADSRRTRSRWFAHSAWKRVPSGTPAKLDEDVMELVLREQDLGLSDEDDFSLGFHNTWGADETAPWPLPE